MDKNEIRWQLTFIDETPRSAYEIHNRRYSGTYVPLRYTVEGLKALRRLGLVDYNNRKWSKVDDCCKRS